MTANDSRVAQRRNERERRIKERTDIRKTKNDRKSKQTTNSGRQEARSERIDEIQWGNYSDRQIHSSDVRRGNNDRERQSKERSDVGKTKNDRNSKQSR